MEKIETKRQIKIKLSKIIKEEVHKILTEADIPKSKMDKIISTISIYINMALDTEL